MMTYNEVRLAITAHLKELNGFVPLSNFRAEGRPTDGNGAFIVPTNGVWVNWLIQYANSFIPSVGNEPCVRKTGQLVFQIFDRKGQGVNRIEILADELTKHFQSKQLSHVEFLEASLFDAQDDDFEVKNLMVRFRVN